MKTLTAQAVRRVWPQFEFREVLMPSPRSLSYWTSILILPSALAAGCVDESSDGPDAAVDASSASDAAGDSTDATGSEDAADNSTDAVGVEDAEEGDGDAGEGVTDIGPDAVVDAGDASDTGSAGDAGAGPDASSELRCTIPSVVDAEVVVDTGCPPIESEGVSVVRGGRLVLNPGVEVRFARGALLVVEGGGELSARGTPEATVTLAGIEAERGSWQGLLARFAGTETSTVRLEHAVLRHGGFSGSEALACLTSIGSVTVPNLIEIRDTTISDCAVYGVLVMARNQDFAAFERVRITGTDRAMGLPADVIGSVPAGVVLDPDAVLQNRGGNVAHTQTWQPQSVPWQVDVAVDVGGSVAPVLTLADGLALEFVDGGDMIVGATPGGLVAERVTFRRKTAGGPWGGIRFLEETTVGSLTGVDVSGTGGPPGSGDLIGAGVLMRGTADRVSIRDSVFSDNTVDIAVDCDSTPVLSGNTAAVTSPSGC